MKLDLAKFYLEVHRLKPMKGTLVLTGYGDYRARLDLGVAERIDGWMRTVTKVSVWQGLPYNVTKTTRDIFTKSWIH